MARLLLLYAPHFKITLRTEMQSCRRHLSDATALCAGSDVINMHLCFRCRVSRLLLRSLCKGSMSSLFLSTRFFVPVAPRAAHLVPSNDGDLSPGASAAPPHHDPWMLRGAALPTCRGAPTETSKTHFRQPEREEEARRCIGYEYRAHFLPYSEEHHVLVSCNFGVSSFSLVQYHRH